MSFLIVTGSVFAGLFLVAYLTKRRLGMLGLALGVGSILAALWTSTLTPLVAQAGIEIIRPPLSSLIATVIMLAPVVLLFFHGATAHGFIMRFGSALVFGLLALAFLIEPLSAALIIDSQGEFVHDLLVQYRPIIITAGLLLAMGDLMFGGKAHRREKPAKH